LKIEKAEKAICNSSSPSRPIKNELEQFVNDDGSTAQDDVLAFLRAMRQHGLKVFMAIAGEDLGDGKEMKFVGHFTRESLPHIVGQIHHMVVKKGDKLKVEFQSEKIENAS
jgi:hypothetical protein